MLPEKYLPLTTFTRVFDVGRHTRICNVTLHQVEAHKRHPFRFRHRSDQGRVAFTLVLKGMAQYQYHSSKHAELTAGSFIKMNKNEAFIADPKQEWQECSIVLDVRTLQFLNGLGFLRHKFQVEHLADSKSLCAAYLHVANSIETAQDDHTVTSAIVEWARVLTLALNKLHPSKDGIERACDWLESTVHLRPGLSQAAEHAGMSEATLRRKFRERHGNSIGRWLLQKRIEKAQALLFNHDIAEVSEALGYPDRFAFSRQFKQITGQTPGHWQRSVIG